MDKEHITPAMDLEGNNIRHSEVLRIDEILLEILGEVITEATSGTSTTVEAAQAENSGPESGLDSGM